MCKSKACSGAREGPTGDSGQAGGAGSEQAGRLFLVGLRSLSFICEAGTQQRFMDQVGRQIWIVFLVDQGMGPMRVMGMKHPVRKLL